MFERKGWLAGGRSSSKASASERGRRSGKSALPRSSRQVRLETLERLEERIVLSTLTWTGAVDANWGTMGNWSGGTGTEVPDSPDDILVFASGASNLTNTNDITGLSIDQIQIDASGYTLGGNSLDLNGSITASYVSGNSEIQFPIALQATQTIDVATGGRLAIAQSISGTGFGVTKTGGGLLVFAGNNNANTYTGDTTVNDGVLQLYKDPGTDSFAGNLIVGDGSGTGDSVQLLTPNQIPDTSSVTLNEGATFDLNGFSDTTGSLNLTGASVTTGAGTLTIASGSSITTNASSTTSTLSGNLSYGGPNNFINVAQGTTSSGVDLEISAVVSSGMNIIKEGEGTLLMSGANTYSGGTNINAGVLALSNNTGAGAGVVNILSTGTLDLSGGITVSNNLNVSSSGVAIRNSGGVNTLSGAISASSDTTIDAADTTTLAISGDIDGTVGLVKTGAGLLSLSGNNTYTGATAINEGVVAISNANALGNTSGGTSIADGARLEVSGGITVSEPITSLNGTGDFFGALRSTADGNTWAGDIVLGTSSWITSANGTFTISGNISDSGGETLTQAANGTLVLSGTNTFSALDITGGTVALSGGAALADTATVTVGAADTLRVDANETIGSINSTSSSSALNLNGGTLTTGGDNTDTTFDGTISGTGGLTKTGDGTLLLSGTNTYSGTTTISGGGTLAVTGANALGATSGGTLISSSTGILELRGGVTLAAEPISFTSTGTIFGTGGTNEVTGNITLPGANARIQAEAGTTLTVSGIIGGAATQNLLVGQASAAGTVIFTAANTFNNFLSIQGGTLVAANNQALGGTTNFTQVLSNTSLVLPGGISLAEPLKITGNGFGGNGAILSQGGSNSLSGIIDLTGNARIGADSDTLTISGTINGSSSITKVGAGTVVLSGTNNYTGATQVSGGTLIVSSSLASSAMQVNSGGTLGGTGSSSTPLTVNSGGIVAPGNSPGIMDVGDTTLDTGGTFEVELDGTTVGTQYDQLNVSGTVALVDATLDVAVGYAAAINDTFTIINNDASDAVTGTFAGLAEGGTFLSGPYEFTITYAGGDGNDVVITVTAIFYTWDGGGADNNWSTAANWVGDIVPVEGASLIFPDGAARLTNLNDFAANTDFNTITFGGAGYILSGNAIDLLNGVTGTFTAGTSQLFMNLVFLADITVDVAADGIVDFYGAVSESGGSFDLTKVGGGSLYIDQAATYSGDTNINDGTLTINGGTILPSTSAVTIGSSGTLRLAGNGTIASIAGSGFVTLLSNTLTVGDANDTTYAGVISGSGGLTKVGSGALTLSGANTYSGATTVNAGAIEVASDAALGTTAAGTSVTSGASVYFNGSDLTIGEAFTIQGTGVGAGGVLYVNSGSTTITGNIDMLADSQLGAADGATLTLSGRIDDTDISPARSLTVTNGATGRTVLDAQQRYDGQLTVTAGYLRATRYGALHDPSVAVTVTVQDGATLELSGGASQPAIHSIVLDGLPVAGSSKVVNVSGDNTLLGNISITGGNNVAFAVDGGDTLTLAGAISGSLDFDKNGTGTLVLSGVSTHTGNVNVGDGTLIVDGSLATSNLVFVDGILGGTGTLPAVAISGIGTLAPGNSPGILSSGNVTFVSGSTFEVELDGTAVGTGYDQLDVTGTVDLGGSTLDVSVGFVPAIDDVFTIINNDGSDPIVGTFVGLAEGSTFTIGAATFAISYSGGDGNDVVLIATSATFTWDGGGADSLWSTAANWVGDVAPTAGVSLVFADGAARLSNINDFAANTDFVGITIAGAGYSLSGNVIDLAGTIAATYAAGSSTITLDVRMTDGITIDVADGGTLVMENSISPDNFGAVYVLTKDGGGTLRYTGSSANTYNGGTVIDAGTLVLAKSDEVIASNGNVTVGDNTVAARLELAADYQFWAGATVTVNEGSTFDVGSHEEYISVLNLQGATVQIDGGGSLRLHSYLESFATTNNETSNIHGPGTLILNSGTVQIAVADDASVPVDLRIGAVLSGPAAGFIKQGGGSLALSGDNTFGGDVDVTAGTLVVESGTALGTTDGGTTVQGGATLAFSNAGGLNIAEELTVAGSGVGGNGALATILGATTLSGTITLAADSTIFAGPDEPLTISGVIGDGGNGFGLAKGGAGSLTLSGANTFGGEVLVQTGILQVEDEGALGSTDGGTVVSSGAVLAFAGSSMTFDEEFAIAGQGISFGGALRVESGDVTLDGDITLAAESRIATTAGTSLTINGVIDDVSSFGLSILSASSGLVTLGGSNAFDGGVTIDGGILRVANDNALGDASFATNVFVNSGASLDLSGGITLPGTKTIVLDGLTAPDVSKVNNVSGDNSILGDIEITGGNNVSFGVGGSDTLTLAGAISGSLDFDKNGTGTLVLWGVSTHTGNVSVGDGTLLVNGSIATSNVVNVEGTLGGSGTLPAVSVTSIGTLAPGNSPGILSSGDVTFVSGATFEVELNGTYVGAQYDQLNVTGTVDLGGSTLDVSLGFAPTIGDAFTIINNDDADAVTGTFNGLAEGATFDDGAYEFTISYVGGDGNDVVLTVTDVSYVWSGASIDGREWTLGDNWVGGVAPTAGARLIFGETGFTKESLNNFANGTAFHSITIAASGYDIYGEAITLTGAITTTYASGNSSFDLATELSGAQTFDVASGGTLSFTGALSGANVPLTKAGGGTLTLSGTNTREGTTTISAGTLAVSGGSALPDVMSTLVEAGTTLQLLGDETLNLNGSGSVVLSGGSLTTAGVSVFLGTISGTGNVTYGGLSLSLSGANTYSGSTTIANSLSVENGAAIPDDSAVTIEAGATLILVGPHETIGSLAGSGNLLSGSFPITVGGDNTDTTFSGTISETGSLIKVGTGTMTLDGYNDYTGATVVSGGTLIVNGSIADSSSLTMADGTTLGGLGLVPELIVQAGATVAPGNSPGTLTVDGNLAFAAGSTFAVELDGTVAIDEYDQMIALGEIDLGGSTLLVTLGDGFDPGAGDQFLILDNQGGSPIVGTFAGLAEGAVLEIDGAAFRISYVGGDGDDVELTTLVATTTTVVSSANPSAFGDDVTFTITVTGSVGIPTGTVSLTIGGTTWSGVPLDGSGMASVDVPGLNPGAYNVFVAYDGDGGYLPSEGELAGGQVVGEAPSNTGVIASANPSAFGQSVTFTATVSGTLLGMPTPTGTVEFYDGAVLLGSATLSDGTATLTISTLQVGGHSITANYQGDVYFQSSTSPVFVQAVDFAVVGLSVIPSEQQSVVTGQSLTFDISTATLAPGVGTPQGTVRVSINGVPEDDVLLDSNGEGSITIDFDATGTYLVSFQFLGNSSFVGEGVLTIGVDVTPDSTVTTLTSSTGLSVVGQPVTLTATVASQTPGSGTPEGSVSFFQGNQFLGSAPLVDGVASLSVANLPYGQVEVEASYEGSSNYGGSESEVVSIAVTVVMGDYDGDGKADLALYEYVPALNSGQFTILLSGGGTMSALLGAEGAIPVVGDFDGDGRSDMAVFNPYTNGATWTILDSSTGELRDVQFGASGLMDLPAPADYDGDGITDIATFRLNSDLVPGDSQWFILPSGGASAYTVVFGGGGGMDMPVPADYDGDGKADIATFRADSDLVPGAAQWFILPSDGASAYTVLFGAGGGIDQPVPADYDGDGKADVATFRTSGNGASAEWFVLPSDGSSASMISLGQVGSLSAPGGYGGPGQADLGTFDRGLAQWRLRAFSDPTVTQETYGQPSPRVVPVLGTLQDRLDAVGDDDSEGADTDLLDELLANLFPND